MYCIHLFKGVSGVLAAQYRPRRRELLQPATGGIYQAWASVAKGLWYARSPEIIHSPLMEFFVWMRVPGDIIFAGGAVALALFTFVLWDGTWRRAAQRSRTVPSPAGAGGVVQGDTAPAPRAPSTD